MSRVFTPDEQRLIRDNDDPDRMLWRLWAGKETAYKVVRRCSPAVSSAPRRYEVKLSSHNHSVPESGTVDTPRGTISVSFTFTDDYVHCIGAADHETINKIIWDVREIPRDHGVSTDESDFVRHMTRQNLSVLFGNDPEEIAIIRPKEDYGLAPPEVRIKEGALPVILSLSHDGRFAACIFTLPQRPGHNY